MNEPSGYDVFFPPNPRTSFWGRRLNFDVATFERARAKLEASSELTDLGDGDLVVIRNVQGNTLHVFRVESPTVRLVDLGDTVGS